MKLVIPGGRGQVGTILARAFHAEDHEAAGFDFEFPEWPTAARDLCSRWRSSRLLA